MLLGEEGRRRMGNKTKTNDQVFMDYYDLIANTHTTKSFYEAKRLLEKFRVFLGQYPPTVELAVQFLTQFKDLKLNSKARYSFVLNAFFSWYSGEKLPIKIRQAKLLPQYVPGEDIDRLIEGIKGKKSHKKSIDRDVLLIEAARMTGLRRGELANLKVGDLHLGGDAPVLIVRQGKGGKDRAVNLNHYIRDRLAGFVKDKSQQDSVFGLAAKTISLKIGKWARKSGVSHLHMHSLRHYVGTTLFERHANPRAVQAILGHESLDVTMRYVSVIGQDTKQAMELLDGDAKPKETISLPPLDFIEEPYVPTPEYVRSKARYEKLVKETYEKLGYDEFGHPESE
jgi:integrase